MINNYIIAAALARERHATLLADAEAARQARSARPRRPRAGAAVSRWMRFLTPKKELSSAELRYFTDLDHHDHEALGALDNPGLDDRWAGRPGDGRCHGSDHDISRHRPHAAAPEETPGTEHAMTGAGRTRTRLRRTAADAGRQL